MKAAIYGGKLNIKLTTLLTPHAGDNDIVIQNIYASICGTDVAVYHHGPGTGHRITVGDEFGHEAISQVVEVGRNVQDIHVGDIVYVKQLSSPADFSELESQYLEYTKRVSQLAATEDMKTVNLTINKNNSKIQERKLLR